MGTLRVPGTTGTPTSGQGLFFNGTIWVPSTVLTRLVADVPPSTSGNVLTSNGSTWTSAAAPGGADGDYGEQGSGTARTAFLDIIPKPGGGAWTWEEHDFESASGLTTLGSTGFWSEITTAPGYAKGNVTSATAAETFYGYERSSDYSAQDFAVVARMSAAAWDNGLNWEAGIYVRQTGGAAGDQSRLFMYGAGGLPDIGLERWNSTTSFAGQDWLHGTHQSGAWVYLAFVTDYNTSTQGYFSLDGVTWVQVNKTETGASWRVNVNGGIFLKHAVSGHRFAAACDWLCYGT